MWKFGRFLIVIGMLAASCLHFAAHATDVLPSQTLTDSKTVSEMGFILDPPPPGYQPTVSAGQAVAIAEAHEDTSTATTIAPVLALFTDPTQVPVSDERVAPPTALGTSVIQKVPAWLVTIDGICIPVYGGLEMTPGPAKSCAGTEATVVINATTAQFMLEYS